VADCRWTCVTFGRGLDEAAGDFDRASGWNQPKAQDSPRALGLSDGRYAARSRTWSSLPAEREADVSGAW